MEGMYTVSTVPAGFVQCGLCNNAFNQPRALPCLHSYCHSCIKEHLNNKNVSSNAMLQRHNANFTCPDCNMQLTLKYKGTEGTDVDELLESFPENTFLEKVTRTVKSLTKDGNDCDICRRSGKYTDAAANWCCDCYEALCESCTAVHQFTAVTSEHQVCTIVEARVKPLSALLRRRRDVTCQRHKGETVKLFCKMCAVTLCAQCVTEQHRDCGTCLTISDACKRFEDELDTVSAKLDDASRVISEAKGHITKEKESFNDRIESIQEEIKAISKNLCERIQESEKNLLKELDRLKMEAEPELLSGVKRMDHCADKVQKTRDIIQKLLYYGSDSEIMSSFADILEQTMQTENTVYQEAAFNQRQLEVSFAGSKVTETFSAEFETLGSVNFIQNECDKSEQQFGHWGITCISRDELVVVDGTNKAIHKFRRGGALLDQIAVTDEPRDVTHLGAGNIAVTLSRKQIMFLSTVGKIKLKHTVKTQKSYHGIDVCGSESFAVSHLGTQKSVDLITMSGVIQRTISLDNQGDPIFWEPRYVVTTSKGEQTLILVSDFRQRKIFGLTLDGVVKFRYEANGNGHKTFRPLGICTDRVGDIFVADYNKDEVILLKGDGTFNRSVVTGENELNKPVAINISRDGRLLVLQNDGMVKVFSY